jgi:hypothetical protein
MAQTSEGCWDRHNPPVVDSRTVWKDIHVWYGLVARSTLSWVIDVMAQAVGD